MPHIEIAEDGDYRIAGKQVTEKDYPELAGRIGPDEAAVEIDSAVLLPFVRRRRSWWRRGLRWLGWHF